MAVTVAVICLSQGCTHSRTTAHLDIAAVVWQQVHILNACEVPVQQNAWEHARSTQRIRSKKRTWLVWALPHASLAASSWDQAGLLALPVLRMPPVIGYMTLMPKFAIAEP